MAGSAPLRSASRRAASLRPAPLRTAGVAPLRSVTRRVDHDYYTAVDQPGSWAMPGTVAVYYVEELDRDGEAWRLDCEPVQPLADSDEYRRRRDEWEARKDEARFT